MSLKQVYLQYSILSSKSFLIAERSVSFVPFFVVPIRNASLGSIPYGDVEDGSGTAFLCSVKEGSWPIHFKIFKKSDHDTLLYEKTESTDRIVWHKETMSRQDTGTYYCMVSNRAKVNVKSHPITINGKLTFTISCILCYHGRWGHVICKVTKCKGCYEIYLPYLVLFHHWQKLDRETFINRGYFSYIQKLNRCSKAKGVILS